MHDELITVDELAQKLKVKKSWIYARTREKRPGAMPTVRAGKYRRFSYREVLDWLRKNQSA
jgi:excisionase family DNA binding protein